MSILPLVTEGDKIIDDQINISSKSSPTTDRSLIRLLSSLRINKPFGRKYIIINFIVFSMTSFNFRTKVTDERSLCVRKSSATPANRRQHT